MASEWQEVQIKDIVTFLGDGLHGTPIYDDAGDYYFINGNNLENGRIVFKDATRKVNHFEYIKHKKNLNDRTIFVSINGTIGNVAIYNGEKVILGKSACYLNVKSEVDKQFVRYIFTDRNFQSYIDSQATGTTIKNVSLKLMRDFRFNLPSFEEQKAIAHILGSLDDKIELNRQMNATLEAMAQALFKSWFVDFDPVIDNALAAGNPIPDELEAKAAARQSLGEARKPLPEDIRSLFPNAFVFTEEMGWIPEGWEVGSLKQLTTKIGSGATPKGGKQVYQDFGTALIRSQNVYDSEFVWDGLAHITDEAALQLQGVTVKSEDVLLNITGASILRTCVVNPDALPARVNQHVVIIRAKENISSRYLHLHLLQKGTKDYLMGLNAGGSREAVTKAHVESVPTLVPNNKLLEKFHDLVMPTYKKVNQLNNGVVTLSNLRDALLPKLLSGELRIPEAERLVEEVIA